MKPAIVIIGINSDLGVFLAEFFIEKNYTVIGTYRTINAATQTLIARAAAVNISDETIFPHTQKTQKPQKITLFNLDLTQREQILRFTDALQKEAITIDCLIFAAAQGQTSPSLAHLDDNEISSVIATNVTGTIVGTKHLLALMGQGSHILYLSSILTKRPLLPGYSVYTATKMALESFIISLAAELAPQKIRVNGLCLGFLENHDDAMTQYTLLQTLVPFDDVAQQIHTLIAGRGLAMTGSLITLDAGAQFLAPIRHDTHPTGAEPVSVSRSGTDSESTKNPVKTRNYPRRDL